MTEYFLQSERLGFRFWSNEDRPLALKLWGDPLVTKFFSKQPLTGEEVEQRLEREILQQEKTGLQYWPIFDLSKDCFVGCCGLRPYGSDGLMAEIGFHLVSDQWGKGLAQEAGRAVIEYAFGQLQKRALFAGHHPDNKGSRNTLLKLGFIGTTAQYYEPTGLNHPSYFLYQSPQDCSLRRAQALDAAAIAALHFISIGKTFSQSIPDYVNSRTLDDFERLWKERLDEPTCSTCVLIAGEQIVGFVSAGKSRDADAGDQCGSVDRIYLHPSVWERRLGGRLLKWCEDELIAQNYRQVTLWVFEPNARAIRFYERNGYRHDGLTKEDFNSRLLRFEKSLV